MSEWISVKDRLPSESCYVLALVSGKPTANITLDQAHEIAEYYPADGWYIELYPDWDNPTVTHWMELPDLPEDER